jgi:hypothetical protein
MIRTTVTLFLRGVFCLCVGCATTQHAVDRMTRTYTGQSIDAFFRRHGAPAQQHRLHSGETLYTWNSEVHSFAWPQTTTFSGTASPYGFSGTAHTLSATSIDVGCTVQLVAAPDGTLTDVRIVRDTFGLWSVSRCAEIFKE